MKRARLLVVAMIAVAGAAFVFLWRAEWPLARFVVDGASMEPAYRAGDRVVVYRWAYRRRGPAADDVVVLRDPERADRWIVKRVAFDVVGAGGVFVLGDHAAASRDSRMFGEVAGSAIVGRVVMRY